MSKITTFLVWFILVTGVAGLLLSNLSSDETFFFAYKSLIELYLFGFTSFLILKRVFFYRLKGNVDVIRLVKKSSFQVELLWQGLVLALIYLVYNFYFYGDLLHFNTVMIAILLLYYVVQLVLNNSPSIYIDEKSFNYDDFFVDQWRWKDVKRIELENQLMRLVSNEKDFELDFDSVDEMDYVKLNKEVEHNILDGDFGRDDSSKTLVEILQTYASLYNVRLIDSANRAV